MFASEPATLHMFALSSRKSNPTPTDKSVSREKCVQNMEIRAETKNWPDRSQLPTNTNTHICHCEL